LADSTAGPNKNDLAKALRFFVGRLDTFSLQQTDGHYERQKRELSDSILLSHCRGDMTVGTYTTNDLGNSPLAVLDIDCREKNDSAIIAQQIETMKSCGIIQWCKEWLSHYDIPCFIEFSGRKGYHLWIVFKKFCPADKARFLLEAMVSEWKKDNEPAGFNIEYNPKQIDKRSFAEPGNLVKLPWGKHRVTGVWNPFVNGTFKPLPDWGLAEFNQARAITEMDLDAILAEVAPSQLKTISVQTKENKPPKEYPDLTKGEQKRALGKALESCAFLSHCKKDAASLPEPEWQAMIELLIFFGEPGVARIHELSSPYPAYSEEATNKKINNAVKAREKKKLGPYTCQKIEQSLGFSCPEDCSGRHGNTKTPVTTAIKAVMKREEPPPLEDMQPIHIEEEEERRPRIRKELIGLTPERVKTICSKGFLRSYLDWASKYTDAPLAFHLATALSMVATAMGNKVKAWAWGRDLYPNLWIVILSPSGFYRKTTCIRLGMRILKRELGDVVLPSEWSKEKVIGLLAQNPAGLFEWDEFGAALGMLSKDYMTGSKETLTKLFDSMDTYSRVTGTGGQSGTIDKPAPNILGGSTIEWLSERVKDGDLRGGFMSRFLFIPGTQKEPEKDFHAAYDAYMEDSLGTALKNIAALEYEVKFDPIHALIKDWVHVHEDTASAIPPELMGFISRGETYLLKLIMVIGACSYPQTGTIEISEDVFNRAELLLDSIKDGVASTVTELNVPKEGKELDKMRELLKRYCPMTKRESLQRSRLKARNFDLLFNTLLQTGEVAIEQQRGKRNQLMQVVVWRGD